MFVSKSTDKIDQTQMTKQGAMSDRIDNTGKSYELNLMHKLLLYCTFKEMCTNFFLGYSNWSVFCSFAGPVPTHNMRCPSPWNLEVSV